MSTVAQGKTRNGVNTEVLYGTLDAISESPELARFQFRVSNQWLGGAHNRSTVKGLFGAGQEDTSREEPFHLDAGEPPVLLGANEGPNPAEAYLHALAACLTTSLVYVAAARKVNLTRVESSIEGDCDIRGALGLSEDPRNGFENINVRFTIEGDADEDTLRELMRRARERSFVFDCVSNGVPVQLDLETS